MMLLGRIFTVALLYFTAVQALAETDAAAFFLKGLKAAQAKNLDEAEANFQMALKIEAENPYVMFNMGVVEFQRGRLGRAVGWWRASLAIKPGFESSRRAMEYVQSKGMLRDLQSRQEWESFRSFVLAPLRLEWIFGLVLLSSLFMFWSGIRYWAVRRQAQKGGEDPPSPQFKLWLLVGLSIVCLVLLGLKTYDYNQPRGTLIEKSGLRTGPNAEDTVLIEVSEGQELFLKAAQGDWVWVQTLGGLSGWVPRTLIIPSGGKKLW